MRTTLLLLLFICLQSCCPTRGLKRNSDYIIVEMALDNYFERDQYRLLKTPDQLSVDCYYGGFKAGEVLLDYRFTYKGTGREEWKKDSFLDGNIKERVLIIDDFSKISKVDSNREAKEYMSISRPLYSPDGKYAVVVINSFYNIVGRGAPAGYGFVFKKEKGKWELYIKYTPYFS